MTYQLMQDRGSLGQFETAEGARAALLDLFDGEFDGIYVLKFDGRTFKSSLGGAELMQFVQEFEGNYEG
jgi:hypothetical protein